MKKDDSRGIELEKKICLLLILILSIGTFEACRSGDSSRGNERTLVKNAACAKFEYANETGGGYKVITSEISILTNSFDDLILEKSDEAFSDDWIYRITFNWNGIVTNGKKIVVLVNHNSISIDGVNYTTENGVDFSEIFDWVKNKYNYFDYDLQYDNAVCNAPDINTDTDAVEAPSTQDSLTSDTS